ncbi:hypothetical protein [Kitasatospora sp. NPDC057595]|uniref:hypothetical protein n=1 Tax=Kitasatospora sp. NPDC057595 TaxID=3346177 RepID=UPI0036A8A0A9
MTVLHSRNADAADAAGSADVKDTTDTKAATDTADTADTAESANPADTTDTTDTKDVAATADTGTDTGLREDLGRYAELGAFTLTADTHPWYAALDTVATPEDARAASTVLAELRGHDLQQVWEDVTTLAADVKLDAPDTVGKSAVLVEMLQLVRRTATVLVPAAYDTDLESLIAATADRNWRRERGVKLSWLRARSLRKQAAALAVTSRPRAQDLHEALASAEVERRAWAALASVGTLPSAPSDGELAHRTAQAFEAVNSGVRELARLLPGQDLDGLSFPDLVDLVDRLATDEGTLYRLPTLRGLRATLEDAGLADLLTELAATHADRRAAEAAYTARQALAGGQRDGLTPATEERAADATEDAAAEAVEGTAEAVNEAEAEAETETAEAVTAVTEPEAAAEAEATTDEKPLSVTLPAPSPAADDLVGITAAPPAQPSAPDAETIAPDEAEAEVAVEAEAEGPAIAVVTTFVAVDDTKPEPVAEAEAAEEPAEPAIAVVTTFVAVDDTKPEPVAEAEAAEETVEPAVDLPVEAEPVAEEATPEVVAEPVADEVVEPAAEVAVEAAEETLPEPVAEVAAEAVAETAVEAPADEVAETDVEEVTPEAAAEVVAEPVAETPAEETVEPVVELPVDVEPVAEEATPEVVAESAVEVPADDEVEPETAAEDAVATSAEAEAAVEPEPEAEPVAETAEEPATEPATAPEVGGRPEKPEFTPGRPVTAYSAEELLAIVRWVDGDGVERSDEELLRAAMKELGFARLGPRIKEALGAAVGAARA